MISIQSNRILTLAMEVDSDYILGIGSLKGFDFINVAYLSVGQKMV